MATYETSENSGIAYPLTNMNFLVSVQKVSGTAAFKTVSGIEGAVAVIPFRQGNSHSLAPVKIPGLVSHGEITLTLGYTLDSAFKTWMQECVSEVRKEIPRSLVQIELIDINGGAPKTKVSAVSGKRVWQLTNAWVCNYKAPELDAMESGIAIETATIAYEELIIPN